MHTGDLDELYVASYRRLVVQLYVLCGDLVDAEDAVQEGFVTAIRKHRELAGVGDPEAWVRTVAMRRLPAARREPSGLDELRAPAGQVRPPFFDALVTTARRRNLRTAVRALGLAGAAAILLLGYGSVTETGSPSSATTSRGTAVPVLAAFIHPAISVGRDPYAMAVHPTTGEVYVTNRADGTVSVIDPHMRAVTATIPVGHEPGDLAIDPTTGLVYVANAGGASSDSDPRELGSISVVDADTKQVVDVIAMPPGGSPGAMALDPSTRSLFVASRTDTTVVVVDTDTNRVVKEVELGWPPGGVAVSSATGEAYIAKNDGAALRVIDTRTRDASSTYRGFGQHLEVDPAAGLLLVGNESRGTVTVVEASTRQPLGTIDVGGRGPFSIEVDPLAARAYVTGGPDGTMAVLDTTNLVVVKDVVIPGASSVFTNPVVDVDTASVYLIVGRRGVGVMARK